MISVEEQAIKLVGTKPLPDDAVAQLQALEAEATDDELLNFPDLWEALEIQLNKQRNLPA